MFGILRAESPNQMPTSPETSPPPPRSMAPMPASQFSSREELLASAKEWAAHQGYAIVIARSRFNRLWLKCDRGGKYENRRNLEPAQRKRKRGDSRLLGCPFKMLAIVRKDGIWRVQTEIPEHNHGPSEDLSMHPTLRRLTEAQTQKVNDMTDSGNTPAETLEELRKLWPDIKVLTRDIYNARKKYKAQKDIAELAADIPQDRPFEDPNGTFPGPTPKGRWEWVPDGEEVTNKNKKRKRRPPPDALQHLDPQLQQPPPQASSSSTQTSLYGGSSHYLQQTQGAQSQQQQQQQQQKKKQHQQQEQQQQQQGQVQNRNPALGGFDHQGPSHTHLHQNPSFAKATEHPHFSNSEDGPPLIQTTNHPHPSSHLRQQHQYTHPPSAQAQAQARATAAAAAATAAAVAETAIMSNNQRSSPRFNNESNISSGGPMNMNSGGGAPHISEAHILSRIERMEKDQLDSKRMLAQILGAVQSQRTQLGGGEV